MKYIATLGILLFGLLCFVTGNIWYKYTLLDSALILTETLTIQSDSKQLGRLPKNTILYPYSSGPSIDTYVVFVNTKNRDVLKPVSFERYMTVAPVDGYRN